MKKGDGIKLTNLECLAASLAIGNFTVAATMQESVDFFGDVQTAKAAVRADRKICEYYSKIMKDRHLKNRRSGGGNYGS